MWVMAIPLDSVFLDLTSTSNSSLAQIAFSSVPFSDYFILSFQLTF